MSKATKDRKLMSGRIVLVACPPIGRAPAPRVTMISTGQQINCAARTTNRSLPPSAKQNSMMMMVLPGFQAVLRSQRSKAATIRRVVTVHEEPGASMLTFWTFPPAASCRRATRRDDNLSSFFMVGGPPMTIDLAMLLAHEI